MGALFAKQAAGQGHRLRRRGGLTARHHVNHLDVADVTIPGAIEDGAILAVEAAIEPDRRDQPRPLGRLSARPRPIQAIGKRLLAQKGLSRRHAGQHVLFVGRRCSIR